MPAPKVAVLDSLDLDAVDRRGDPRAGKLQRKLVPAVGGERDVAGSQRLGERLEFPTAVRARLQPVSLGRLGGLRDCWRCGRRCDT